MCHCPLSFVRLCMCIYTSFIHIPDRHPRSNAYAEAFGFSARNSFNNDASSKRERPTVHADIISPHTAYSGVCACSTSSHCVILKASIVCCTIRSFVISVWLLRKATSSFGPRLALLVGFLGVFARNMFFDWRV